MFEFFIFIAAIVSWLIYSVYIMMEDSPPLHQEGRDYDDEACVYVAYDNDDGFVGKVYKSDSGKGYKVVLIDLKSYVVKDEIDEISLSDAKELADEWGNLHTEDS